MCFLVGEVGGKGNIQFNKSPSCISLAVPSRTIQSAAPIYETVFVMVGFVCH